MIETKGQRKAANILDTIQAGSVETVFYFKVVYDIRESYNI